MSKREEFEIKIIDAAIQEFRARGLESGSMENIAKKAQISKRTLYKYFASKESIFDALIQKLLITVCGNSSLVYSKAESIEFQLSRIIDHKIDLLTSEEYLNISRMVLCEVMKGRKLEKKHLEKFYESEFQSLKWIDAAKRAGEITSKQPSDLISNQLHSIIKGQLFYPVIFGVKELTKNDVKVAKKITMEFFINSFCR